ncbi:MAG: excinuclease ABC subunit C, partial [Alistipes sp.]|nr:excinuclease ABC subunit C [Alistipes sp.]
RMEEIFFPNDPEPYYLSRTGEPLKVVCHIRDEAHRFGITFHRKKRSLSFINSEINEIPGIGEKNGNAILKHFKSVSNIRRASLEELSEVVGPTRAQKIIEYFASKPAK